MPVSIFTDFMIPTLSLLLRRQLHPRPYDQPMTQGHFYYLGGSSGWGLRAFYRVFLCFVSFANGAKILSYRRWEREPAEEDRLCLKVYFPFLCAIFFPVPFSI